MLRFLSSLFTTDAEPSNGLDEDLIAKAVERVLAGTDRRLSALKDCRKRLHDPVGQAVAHVIALVDALPPPVEVSPQGFRVNDGLRPFFVSTGHVQEVLGKFDQVRDYIAGQACSMADEIYGLTKL